MTDAGSQWTQFLRKYYQLRVWLSTQFLTKDKQETSERMNKIAAVGSLTPPKPERKRFVSVLFASSQG